MMRKRYNPEDDKNKQARLHSQAKHQLLLVSTDELQKTLFRAWFEFSSFMSITYHTSHSKKIYVSEHCHSLGKDSAEEAHESQQCKTKVERRSEEQSLPKPQLYCHLLLVYSFAILLLITQHTLFLRYSVIKIEIAIVVVFSFVSPIDCYIGLQLLEVGVPLTFFFFSLSSCLPCLTILGDYY